MSRLKKLMKALLSIVILSATLLQSGCAFKDIDKRVFVIGIGIDPADKVRGGFKVTLKMAKPIGDLKQAPTQTYAYLSHESASIGEAIRSMETRIDKVLDFAHNRIIVLNEELLSQNLDTFMDFFTRRGDIQLITYMAVAETTAEETISFEPETETSASIALYNFFDETGTESPFVITSFLFEFRRQVLSKGISPIMPVIGINEEKTAFIINKSIVLKLENKPVKLTSVETKYFNSLMHNARGFSYKIKHGDLIMILNIDTIKMKYKIIVDDGPPRIDMKVTKYGVIGEANERLHLGKVDEYSKIASEEMKKIVMELLTTLQKEDVDPFGFGLRYRATRLSREGLYEEWKAIYPKIEFNVTMDVNLKTTGVIE